LNAVFPEWMERLQKCVQVDGEHVGWAHRRQYLEIDFNREIRLCYTWLRTPYMLKLRISQNNSVAYVLYYIALAKTIQLTTWVWLTFVRVNANPLAHRRCFPLYYRRAWPSRCYNIPRTCIANSRGSRRVIS
jgi:hypothetical protein